MNITSDDIKTLEKILLYLLENNPELYNELYIMLKGKAEEDRIKQEQYKMLDTIKCL